MSSLHPYTPPPSSLLLRSAMELARMIRDGETSSHDIVCTHIEHVCRVNPGLNALVHERFAQAMMDANAADEVLEHASVEQPLGPLHGVPCSIQESLQLTGMPHTAGVVARQGLFATQDAHAVRRLRDAGAIPLGVTNTSELCMWYETHNNVYGRTVNAYNERHISGGGAGGEGALIGAGGTPFGLGAGGGGAIRLPAFFNGIFAHKPSAHLVPYVGQYPRTKSYHRRYHSVGPLCRRAEDLMPLLSIIAEPSLAEAGCEPMMLGDPGKVDVSDLAVFLKGYNGTIDVHADVLAALHHAGSMLERLGASVREAHLEDFEHVRTITQAILMHEPGGASTALLAPQRNRFRPGRELIRWSMRRSAHTIPSIMTRFFRRVGGGVTPARQALMRELGICLRRSIIAMLGPQGVLLHPTFSSSAPRHLEPLLKPFHVCYASIFNALELPVTQVPLGLDRDGLPVGVQVVATPGNDHVAIAVAIALEDAFGGWVPPWHVV